MTSSATSPATASGKQTVTMSEKAQQQFGAELEKLGAARSSGPRDRIVQILGLVLAVVGIAVALLCYSQATTFDDLRDQLQVSILAMVGLGLVVLGTGLFVASTVTRFLRLWMLRLVYEQHEHPRR